MAYDEGVAERLREVFAGRPAILEKRMFGGLAFMLRRNMCCGVIGDTLMARVGPDQYRTALKWPHAREMDFTGKPLNGLVYVAPAGFESDEDLAAWVVRELRGFAAAEVVIHGRNHTSPDCARVQNLAASRFGFAPDSPACVPVPRSCRLKCRQDSTTQPCSPR